MPSNYNGTTTGITARQQASISEPVDTDVRNAASVQSPLRTLTNLVHYLMQKAGILDVVSTWTAKQIFSGGVDLNSGTMSFTQLGSQVLQKTGSGAFAIGTGTGNSSPLQLIANGVNLATVGAGASSDVATKGDVGAETAARQAVTVIDLAPYLVNGWTGQLKAFVYSNKMVTLAGDLYNAAGASANVTVLNGLPASVAPHASMPSCRVMTGGWPVSGAPSMVNLNIYTGTVQQVGYAGSNDRLGVLVTYPLA